MDPLAVWMTSPYTAHHVSQGPRTGRPGAATVSSALRRASLRAGRRRGQKTDAFPQRGLCRHWPLRAISRLLTSKDKVVALFGLDTEAIYEVKLIRPRHFPSTFLETGGQVGLVMQADPFVGRFKGSDRSLEGEQISSRKLSTDGILAPLQDAVLQANILEHSVLVFCANHDK
ncbi:hypothetical protein J6590_022572 [Homalodisca vitripennis]|nr:hypothetical protein J6590_022572 [Homalodisca vitripennis]